ncbi:MAG TPA: VanW family protein [Natronosporangium sp.]|nr:VanW family protein [Natronosporangium sp.]
MKFPRLPRTMLIVVAVVIALIATGTVVGGTFAYAGDVPRGTTVLGVDLSAMTREEAIATLEEALAREADAVAAPLSVRVGETVVEVVPAEVGLAVDVAATVDRAIERAHPVPAMFGAIFGPRDVPPVVTMDTEALREQLQEPAEAAGEAMTLPAVRFEGTEPVPVYPEPGLGLDPDLAAERVAAAWPPPLVVTGTWREPAVIEVPLVEITPVHTAEDVDRLVAELARPAVAAPVTATLPGGAELEISPEVIAASLTLESDATGEIVPEVDPKALRKGLKEQLKPVERKPVDARFSLASGRPEIVEEKDGEQVDTEALAADLLPVLSQPQPRTVTATTRTRPAKLTSDDLAELGVKEQISTFTTYYDGGLAEPRNQNIALLADMVDGALVLPGEVFSLNEFSGPRGYEQGFQDAPVILDGRLQPAVGGGLSQFTTTLFNAAFYAGLEDVEHTPHSYYYSRYPAVIEATIFYPSLDMKFRNDTEYGVVIDTSYDEAGITVTLWGTKVWDEVTAEWSDRRDVTQPKRQYIEPGPSCIDTVGIPGFTQDVWRVFYRDGQEIKREKFTWRYDAQPEFICGEKPD